MAAPKKPATPVGGGSVNFGVDSFYSGGFTLPKGRYALFFITKLHTPTKQDGTPAGAARLGIMVDAHPLDGSESLQQFLSMGTKAHLSFMPSADGKGLEPIPGGPAVTAPRATNWDLFRKSLLDCGLPGGLLSNNLAVIDGLWVQTDLVPEPEDRKGFGSQAATGEAAAQQDDRRGSGLVPVVSEILDGGKPWEGGGGMPDGKSAPPEVSVRPGPPAKTTAPQTPAAESSDEDIQALAESSVAGVLEANPAGTTKLKLRTGTYKAAMAAGGQEAAQAIMDSHFTSDANLNGLIGPMGFKVVGSDIKPA